MSAAVIGLGGVQFAGRIATGTPVRLIDGREGWVYGFAVVREAASDDPMLSDIVTRIDHYVVRLTGGRGNVAATPDKLQRLIRDPLPPQSIPKGAA